MMGERILGESPTLFPTQFEPENTCHIDRHYDLVPSILSGIIIFFGVIFLLYGYRLFKLILFLTGFIVGFFSLYIVLSLYLNDVINSNIHNKELINMGIAAGCGLILGLLAVCCFYVGLALLGAALGWFVGMAFMTILIHTSAYVASNAWVTYVILSGFAVVGAAVILCIQKLIIVCSTSFLGAYSIIQALDYFVEKSRMMYYVLEILYNGSTDKLPTCWFTWFMLAWIPALFIVGILIQYKFTGKNYDHRTGYQRPDILVVIPVDSQELEPINMSDNQPLMSDYA